ncbi:MAG: hypothetical protein A2Y07_10700 [Planctomycetes bacterium GWF2_50_10]|nr:MAG: hypothetical protein A2Y07_10700 [Planctomycetes bacterium GWF2_50_10]
MSFEMKSLKIKIGLAIVLGAAVICPAQSKYAVMLQQTPAAGGTIAPGAGVHSVEANAAMTVTAVPRPGYEFVYWLGDVGDPTSATTVVSVNSPKIVVAVFERSEFESTNQREAAPPESQGGGGNMVPSRASISGPSGISPASGGGGSYKGPTYIVNPPEDPEVPEPATICLLSVGALSLIRARRK